MITPRADASPPLLLPEGYVTPDPGRTRRVPTAPGMPQAPCPMRAEGL